MLHSKNEQLAITRRTLAKVSAASLAAVALGRQVSARDATPEGSDSEVGPSMEVLLTGLSDPRFVVVDGTDIYFTEAGTSRTRASSPTTS